MTEPTKILLIDDSVVIRGLLGRCIDAQADMTVLSTAPNGKVGVEKVRALNPDVVVLDIEMPVMNGLDALVEIRKTDRTLPVIMFSTLTAHGASATVKALSSGASDYATKPSNTEGLNEALRMVEGELVDKIRALAGSRRPKAPGPRTAPPVATRRLAAPIAAPRVVVVGSSTGGPVALETFLGGIAEPLPVPMLLVQHMPPKFTEALAKRLDSKVASTVVEANGTQPAEPGVCYIAPGGRHMRLDGSADELLVQVFDAEPVNSCRPAVDLLFDSAARVLKDRVAAVMLTGMGKDGLEGTRSIGRHGCHVIAQDEETSVVWGMPGQVAKAGLATEVLPIEQIGTRIASMYRMAAAMTPAGGAGGTKW